MDNISLQRSASNASVRTQGTQTQSGHARGRTLERQHSFPESRVTSGRDGGDMRCAQRRRSFSPTRFLFNHINKNAKKYQPDLPSVTELCSLASKFAGLFDWPGTISQAERVSQRSNEPFDMLQHLRTAHDFSDRLSEIFSDDQNQQQIYRLISAIASHKGREELLKNFPEPNRPYAKQMLKAISKTPMFKRLAIASRLTSSKAQRWILSSVAPNKMQQAIVGVINKLENTATEEANRVAEHRFSHCKPEDFDLNKLVSELAKVYGNVRRLQINEATKTYNKGLASSRQQPVLGDEEISQLKNQALSQLRQTLSNGHHLKFMNYILHQVCDFHACQDNHKKLTHPMMQVMDQLAELAMPQGIAHNQTQALAQLGHWQAHPMEAKPLLETLDQLWRPVQSQIYDSNDSVVSEHSNSSLSFSEKNRVADHIDLIKSRIREYALDETSYVKFEHLLTLIDCASDNNIFESTRALMHLELENKIHAQPDRQHEHQHLQQKAEHQLRLALDQLRIKEEDWPTLKNSITNILTSLQDTVNQGETPFDEQFQQLKQTLVSNPHAALTPKEFRSLVQVLDGVHSRATLRNYLLSKAAPTLKKYAPQLSLLNKVSLLLGINQTAKADAFHPYPPYTQSNIFNDIPEEDLLGLSNNIVNMLSNIIFGISQTPIAEKTHPEIRNEAPLPEVALQGKETAEDIFNRRLWGLACDFISGTAEYRSEISETPEVLLYEHDLKVEAYAKAHNISTQAAALHVPEERLSQQERIDLMRSMLKKNVPFMINVIRSGKLNYGYMTGKGTNPETGKPFEKSAELPDKIAEFILGEIPKCLGQNQIQQAAYDFTRGLTPGETEVLIDQIPDWRIADLIEDVTHLLQSFHPYEDLPFFHKFTDELIDGLKDIKVVQQVARPLTMQYFSAIEDRDKRAMALPLLRLGPLATMRERISVIAQFGGIGFQKAMQLFGDDVKNREIRETLGNLKTNVNAFDTKLARRILARHLEILNAKACERYNQPPGTEFYKIPDRLIRLDENQQPTDVPSTDEDNLPNLNPPIAAATVGQVHRFELIMRLPQKDGSWLEERKDLAIKIRRPGAESRIHREMDALQRLVQLDDDIATRESLRSVADSMKEETNFLIEKVNGDLAEHLYPGSVQNDFGQTLKLRVAKSYDATHAVLLQEFIENSGKSEDIWRKEFTRNNASHPPEAVVKFLHNDGLLSELLLKNWVSAFVAGHEILPAGNGHIEGDRHGGNSLYNLRDSEKILIDFGAATTITAKERQAMVDLVVAMFYRNAKGVCEQLTTLVNAKRAGDNTPDFMGPKAQGEADYNALVKDIESFLADEGKTQYLESLEESLVDAGFFSTDEIKPNQPCHMLLLNTDGSPDVKMKNSLLTNGDAQEKLKIIKERLADMILKEEKQERRPIAYRGPTGINRLRNLYSNDETFVQIQETIARSPMQARDNILRLLSPLDVTVLPLLETTRALLFKSPIPQAQSMLTDEQNCAFFITSIRRIADLLSARNIPAPASIIQLNRGEAFIKHQIEDNNRLKAEYLTYIRRNNIQNFGGAITRKQAEAALAPINVSRPFMHALINSDTIKRASISGSLGFVKYTVAPALSKIGQSVGAAIQDMYFTPAVEQIRRLPLIGTHRRSFGVIPLVLESNTRHNTQVPTPDMREQTESVQNPQEAQQDAA